MQKAEKRLDTILQKYQNLGIKTQEFTKLEIVRKLFPKSECVIFNQKLRKTQVFCAVFCALGILFVAQTNVFVANTECFMDMPGDASKWFREPESCEICKSAESIPKRQNLTPEEFYRNFVVQVKPVVISDGAKNWPAVEKFSFDFFREIYTSNISDDHSTNSRKTCQFFPYKTEFGSLQEAFNMNPQRANLSPGEKPWYIGWSNCNDDAGRILRKYYKVPYFLPSTSENMALNWIFMGGPGFGAHMHVDNVQFPSWQAQLKGRKMWRFAPPPECYYKCREMQIVVEPGEIIVVDTNRWYHQTFVLPGEISITIGSEFD